MKRPLIFLMCALPLTICLLLSCGKDQILIGFAGQLTGVYSDLGVQARNGANLAVEEINARGGIAGRQLRMIVKDDRNSPETARQVDQELIEKGVVAIIGHMTSSQSMAALPVANKAEVVLLSPTTSTPRLSGQKDMFFRVNGSTSLAAQALGTFARHNLKLNRVNTIRDTDNQAYSLPYHNNFTHSLQKEKGEVVRACTFSSGQQKNWSKTVNCLSGGNPDGILVIASAMDTAALVQELVAQGKDWTIISSGWAATRSLLVHGGKAVEGLFLARTGVAEKQTQAYRDFDRNYRERFGRPSSFAAEKGYQAVKFLARALEKTGGTSKGLPAALTQVQGFQSLYGPLSINRYGDALLPVTVVKVVNGAFKQVSRIQVKEQ